MPHPSQSPQPHVCGLGSSVPKATAETRYAGSPCPKLARSKMQRKDMGLRPTKQLARNRDS